MFFSFNHIAEEEIAGFFTLIVSLLSYGCKCAMSFPHGAMGWSVVCDYVISLSH